jgi:serine/threonine-protein kinase
VDTIGVRHVRTIGRYEVVGHLAEGGMAEILLGRLVGPRGFEHPVVIKRILPHLARSKEFVDMFVDEARIVAAIRHPNVVAVHELGRDGDELFLVLEYLEGESVGSLVRRLWTRGEALDHRVAAHIIAQACAGLHAAHELTDEHGVVRDLVHRDVSPQNVFVTYAGDVKVLDFGIAKAAKRHTRTEAGQLKGKFGYMSPEQCHNKPLDRRSDIFALGTLLYELTTSRRLFKRESELDILKAITEQPIARPSTIAADYPPALEAICMRALERRRSARYETAADMRRDLLAAIHTLGVDRLPEEMLAKQMRVAFADRIEEKRELLRRVQSGSGVSHIPVSEADETVDLPGVTGHVGAVGTSSGYSAPRETRKSARLGQVGVTVGLVIVGSFALYWARHPSMFRPHAEAASPSAAPVESSLASVAPPPADVGSAAPRKTVVIVHIETAPPGATVMVAGRDAGTTPADVSIPQGTAPVSIEIRRDGFEVLSERLIPDVDQRLVMTLHPRPKQRPISTSSAPKPSEPRPPDYIKL